MGKPEGIVEKYLLEKSKELGFLCYKTTSYSKNGFPDRCLIGHGTTFFVETKSDNGKPSLVQQIRHKEIKSHGGIVYTAHTKKDVDNILKKHIERKWLC